MSEGRMRRHGLRRRGPARPDLVSVVPASVLLALATILALPPPPAAALTAAQIQELRSSGVSDQTIQLMLENEQLRLKARQANQAARQRAQADAAALEVADRQAAGAPPVDGEGGSKERDLPPDIRAQIEASRHTGSFDLPDGSRIISTGDHPEGSRFSNDGGGWNDVDAVQPWVNVVPPWSPGPGPRPRPPGPFGPR